MELAKILVDEYKLSESNLLISSFLLTYGAVSALLLRFPVKNVPATKIAIILVLIFRRFLKGDITNSAPAPMVVVVGDTGLEPVTPAM